MSTLLSLRRALGTAVDELAPLAGTAGFAAKEAEVAQLERTIGELDKVEKLAAKLARPIGSPDGSESCRRTKSDSASLVHRSSVNAAAVAAVAWRFRGCQPRPAPPGGR